PWRRGPGGPGSAPVQLQSRPTAPSRVKMTLLGLLLVLGSSWFVSAAQVAPQPAGSSAAPRPANSTSIRGNSTESGGARTGAGLFTGLSVDSSMIQRALYVLIGITMIGVLYFLIRAVRLKRPVQRKKYGLLSNYDDSVEMDAVESDEDDTLYEARSLRRSEVTVIPSPRSQGLSQRDGSQSDGPERDDDNNNSVCEK
ncbi:hypothetical protein L3Q82_026136, partial [Scortum barcoo]